MFGGLKLTLCTSGPRDHHKDWARTMFECFLWRCRSAVACHGGSGCSRLGYGISPREGGSHSLHHRTIRTFTGWGKQTLAGDKQKLVWLRTQEKGSVTPQETDPDLSWLTNTQKQCIAPCSPSPYHTGEFAQKSLPGDLLEDNTFSLYSQASWTFLILYSLPPLHLSFSL